MKQNSIASEMEMTEHSLLKNEWISEFQRTNDRKNFIMRKTYAKHHLRYD